MAENCLFCTQKSQNPWVVMPDGKVYLRCSHCELVWLQPKFRVNADKEKARYLEHNNHLDDPLYLQYLKRLLDKIQPHLASHARGLDYGCGPVKGMQFLAEQSGISIDSFDPIFFPNVQLLTKTYDFLLCSEVAEHFFDPLAQFKVMNSLLNKGAVLGISSHLYPDDKIRFAQWGYRRDPTHVVFYSRKTVIEIANFFGWDILELDSPYWVLKK